MNGVLPAAPPDWRAIMAVSGWDNAINRMMSKFCGNVKVHATAGLIESVKRYLASAPLHEDTARWLLIDSVARRPRPIIAHNDDWHMAMELRRILAGVPDGCTEDWAYRRMVQFHLPERSSYSSDAMLLHLFLTRFGVNERSYLPVASRDRKYSYVDTQVARFLFKPPKKVKTETDKNNKSICRVLDAPTGRAVLCPVQTHLQDRSYHSAESDTTVINRAY